MIDRETLDRLFHDPEMPACMRRGDDGSILPEVGAYLMRLRDAILALEPEEPLKPKSDECENIIAAIRADHERDFDLDVCSRCGEAWPCDVERLGIIADSLMEFEIRRTQVKEGK